MVRDKHGIGGQCGHDVTTGVQAEVCCFQKFPFFVAHHQLTGTHNRCNKRDEHKELDLQHLYDGIIPFGGLGEKHPCNSLSQSSGYGSEKEARSAEDGPNNQHWVKIFDKRHGVLLSRRGLMKLQQLNGCKGFQLTLLGIKFRVEWLVLKCCWEQGPGLIWGGITREQERHGSFDNQIVKKTKNNGFKLFLQFWFFFLCFFAFFASC